MPEKRSYGSPDFDFWGETKPAEGPVSHSLLQRPHVGLVVLCIVSLPTSLFFLIKEEYGKGLLVFVAFAMSLWALKFLNAHGKKTDPGGELSATQSVADDRAKKEVGGPP